MSAWAPIPLIAKKDLVVLDTETGLVGERTRIIEIGMLLIKKGKIVDKFESLIYPEGNIITSWESRITDEDLDGKPTFNELKEAIGRFIRQGELIVAHNAAFDIGMIKKELGKTGENWNPPTLCTLKLARNVLPKGIPKTLEALSRRYGISSFVPHRALPDAIILLKVFGALLAEPLSRDPKIISKIISMGKMEWPP